MVRWTKIAGLALLCGGMLMIGLAPQLRASTSTNRDVPPDNRAGSAADTVEPISRPNPDAVKPLPSGNPLWSVPLSLLTATRQRPIFSSSRRPQQPAVVAPPVERAAPPPKPAEAERPPLALIGAVVGDSDAIAVFLDRVSQKIVRLRKGDAHSGWVLGSVQGREVTLNKGERSEILALQRQEGPAGAAAAGGAPMVPTIPIAGALNGSYAPFTPRSTPKNGEPDGL